MKTELEVRRELREIRRFLKKARDTESDTTPLYYAQQALTWILGEGRSPSDVEKFIASMAETA